MILHLVESTLDSVSKALEDAGRKPGDLDAILLVGGSTRTPLVSRLLRERTRVGAGGGGAPGPRRLVGGSTRTPLVSRLLRERTRLEPREDVHPDLCVALGAGVLASRLAGRDVE